MQPLIKNDLTKLQEMSEIKGVLKKSIFSRIPKDLIGEFILPYFTLKEAKAIGSLNKMFRYCFGIYFNQYVKDWKNRLLLLKDKFNLEVPEDKIDLTELLAIKNQRFYSRADHPENAIQFTDLGKFRYVGIYNRIGWAHTEKPEYYSKEKYANSFDGETRYLISVCWIDCKMNMFVIPKGNYHLKLRHNFKSDGTKDYFEFLGLILTVYVGEKKVFEERYPNKKMKRQATALKQAKTLFESDICDIKKADFKDEKEDIRVEINHNHLYWKEGWSIDALFLEPFEESA